MDVSSKADFFWHGVRALGSVDAGEVAFYELITTMAEVEVSCDHDYVGDGGVVV